MPLTSWPGATDLTLGQGKDEMPSKALFQPHFPLLHLWNIFRKLWCLCFLFSQKKQLGSCLSTQQKAWQPNSSNVWSGCHPFWPRPSRRSWVNWSLMRLPVSNGILGCGEHASPLEEWETFIYFTYITKKTSRREQIQCLWLGDAYDPWWLGWFSEQQTRDEIFHIILPTAQSKYANKINIKLLETHRIQLFWLNYHIHGELQVVCWKISPLSPAIFLFFSSVYIPSIFPSWQRPTVFWEGLKIGFCSTEHYLVVVWGCN